MDLSWAEQLLRLANRVAVNRTVAGVHFPIDSAAGAVLGLTLGQYFVARAVGGTYDAYAFDGTQFPPTTNNVAQQDGDFYWTLYYDVPNDAQLAPAPYVTRPAAGQAVVQSNLLNWLWGMALAEWH